MAAVSEEYKEFAYGKQDLLSAGLRETCLLALRRPISFSTEGGVSRGFECTDFHDEISVLMPFGEENIPVRFVHSFDITASGK